MKEQMLEAYSEYVELHLHSCFSLLDGMSRLEDIIEKVKQHSQRGFAITEHGNTFSSVKMYKLAQENNLKFIFGSELYVCNNRFAKDKDSRYYHLIVLAKNEQGRINLNKLNSLAYIEGFYFKPRIDHELLMKHKEGLIVLSACMAGEVQRALAGGKIGNNDVVITKENVNKAKETALFYKNIFGEDYYLEIQSHTDKRQQVLNRTIVDIAKELDIQYVTTSDSHFVNKEDFELHSIFIEIGTNREAGEVYADTYMQSESDVYSIHSESLTKDEIKTAIKNTSVILNKCNVDLPLSAPLIPHVDVPMKFNGEEDYLKHLINKGWIYRKINKLPKDEQKIYHERLMYEFNAVKEMGFIGYYLLVDSYVNTVKRRGIARGSGGGSLILWLLNIVDINPIKYGLYFERFIDVGALELLKQGIITPKELKIPDVDSDFGTKERDAVMSNIIRRYGKENVASFGQFGYIWDKTAIQDVGRVLNVPPDERNKMTKLIGDDTIQEAIDDGRLSQYVSKYPKLFEYAPKLAGLPRSFGKHPCGKVVTIDEISQYTSVALGKKGKDSDEDGSSIILQLDMDDASDLGLVKIDVLGLRTVDIIYDTLELIGKDYDYISPDTMNFKDEKVLEIFKNGHTDNIFQFESDGMKSTLKKMIPTGLDDLGIANALYRPGSMKFIDNYVNRKHGLEEFEYLHEDLKPILEVTYGIIVFQEQLIEIGKLAGLRNPDLLRQATGKKDVEKMAKVKPELFEGLSKRGWTTEQMEELWSIMLDFAKYSFNKSHSYAYGIIAYICGFLKTYHPIEFVMSALNSLGRASMQDKMEKISKTMHEAKRLGVEFVEHDFRNTSPTCTIQNKKINYGISLIKNCNEQVSYELQELKDNKYDSFVDLLIDIYKTSINATQMKILILLDYFKEFGKKESLLEIYQTFFDVKKFNANLYPEFAEQKYLERIVKKRNGELEEKWKTITRLIAFKPDLTDKNYEERMKNIYDYQESCIKNPPPKIELFEQIEFEKDILGFGQTIFESADYDVSLILNIDTTYSPVLTLYRVCDGEEFKVKIAKKKFFTDTSQILFEGDIIHILELREQNARKMVDGAWTENPDRKDLWCEKLQLLKRGKRDE